jgi:hypothetical protein
MDILNIKWTATLSGIKGHNILTPFHVLIYLIIKNLDFFYEK